MNAQQNWLLGALLASKPNIEIPTSTKLASSTAELWLQLQAIGNFSPQEMSQAVAKASGLETGDFADFDFENQNKISEQFLRKIGALPLTVRSGEVIVAISDPRLTPDQISQLRFGLGAPVSLVILPPDEIDTGITHLFSQASRAGSKDSHIDILQATAGDEDSHTMDLAHAIFRAAIDKKASDIHIHPFVGGGAIRFRIDGLLQRISTIPKQSLQSLSLYLKANAGLESNPLIAQDGRLRLKYSKRWVDVRLSILPVVDGDRIVCRLLEQGKTFSLQNSGFPPSELQLLKQFVSQGAGIVLLTGPTGSGKTSTLYALLSELNRFDVNIITLENPVEYTLPGISQVQISEKQGLSFADTLRSILRQDPDIILVGEIRDSETARIASQAALTGHIVLSTLHTNDALGSIPRLLDLGLESSTLADSLLGIVSQRLLRKLCEACKLEHTGPSTPQQLEFIEITGEKALMVANGCEHCSYTGYSGRIPIIETQQISSELRAALQSGTREMDNLVKAGHSHHRSMAKNALNWVISGQTTLEEISRVMGLRFWQLLADEYSKKLSSRTAHFGSSSDKNAINKTLLISNDDALVPVATQGLGMQVALVQNSEDAVSRLTTDPSVVCLLIDSATMDDTVENWLTKERKDLAWSGLPVIFLVRSNNRELIHTLENYNASWIEIDNLSRDLLAEEINEILLNNTL